MWPGARLHEEDEDGRNHPKDIIADFQGTDEVFARKQASSSWNRSFQGALGTRSRSSVDLVEDSEDLEGFLRSLGSFSSQRYNFEINDCLIKGRRTFLT